MIDGFDGQKCRRRNRILAARGNVEGVGVRFLETTEAGGRVVDSWGELPFDDGQALHEINSRLPQGARPFTLDRIYLHYCEAANGGFIPDRYAFFATSTLLNIAQGGVRGVAFMNSHRTGDISSPAELPFGKTFAGRYEAVLMDDGTVHERAILGFYMIRGLQPNGAGGPSTDDLDAMIDGGTLFDVSVGLFSGEDGQAVCDVCGADYRHCEHVAGTTREMSEEQIRDQKARVASGKASYTLENYQIAEVSGVYDGAVPGAGFAKGLRALKSLSAEEQAQFRAAFHSLFDDSATIFSAPPGKEIAALNGKKPTGEYMAEYENPGFVARAIAFFRGEGIELDAAGGAAKSPAAGLSLARGIAEQASAQETAAALLVTAHCAHMAPSERQALIPLAQAALVLDGGKAGVTCGAFRDLAQASVPVLDMRTPAFAQVAGTMPPEAREDLQQRAKKAMGRSIYTMNGGAKR